MVAPIYQIEDLIKKNFGTDSASMDEILSQLGNESVEFGEEGQIDMQSVEAEANATPIIRYVDLIMYQAIQDRASDIHFEPFESEFKIRYRVDGALYEMAPPPRHLALPVISRVKVMANLNIAERRLPQDGRIQKVIAGRQVDLRVSTLPTQYGESVVLRVLDRSAVSLNLDTLGMPDYIYNYILKTIEKPNGIFIVTGPTGSGKTTTLYACLNQINTIDSKLLTAEDPVEYDIEGIIQVPINEAIGLTFGRALRAFLRQDPDRIMVGETRDLETAQIAIQASLTGHLVFSTLHTNDAPGAVTRLIDMGVEPFMISSSLEGVLGQRLIRKICLNCRTPYEPTEAVLTQTRALAARHRRQEFLLRQRLRSLQQHRLQRTQRHLRTAQCHRSDPRTDQPARAQRRDAPEGDRTRNGHSARGRTAQHLRRRNDHRRSPEIHLSSAKLIDNFFRRITLTALSPT